MEVPIDSPIAPVNCLRETHIGIVARSDVHSAEYCLRLFKHGEIRPQALQDLADSLRQGTLQLGQPRFGDVRLDLWREGSRERLYLGLQIRHLPAFGSESAQSWGDTFVIELLTHEGRDILREPLRLVGNFFLDQRAHREPR